MNNYAKRPGRPPVKYLTDSQLRMLTALLSHFSRESVAPTIAELAAMLRMTPASAHETLIRLEAKGIVLRDPRRARSIRISHDLPAALQSLSN